MIKEDNDMLAIDTHHRGILWKLNALTLFCSMSFFSPQSGAKEIKFEKVSDSEYKITGSVTGTDLNWNAGDYQSYPLIIRAKVSGDIAVGYDGGSKYCNTYYADDAASIINQQLASGINLKSNHGSGGNVPEWSANITCYSPTRGGSWTTLNVPPNPNPPPPEPPACSISVPKTVEFSTLKPGTNPSGSQNANVELTCDKAASGNIEIIGTQSGVLKIADAKVNVVFDNNKLKYSFQNSKQASTNLVVTVQDAGNTTGEKKGSVVLRATWD